MNLCLSKRQLLLSGKKAKPIENHQQDNACRTVHNNPKPTAPKSEVTQNNPKPLKTTYSGRVTPLQAGRSLVTFCFVASQLLT